MSRFVMRLLIVLLVVGFSFLGVSTAFSQPPGYPSKPISLIIPFSAGGGSDIVARLIVSLDSDYFGVNMVPVIKPGASGSIATDYVYHAKPDGYTLLLGAPHMMTILPQMKKVNYDPLKLVPVSQINIANSVIMSPKNRPWKTWEEFVANAQKNPGKLSYGSAGAFGISHVRTAAIVKRAGLSMVHVPYAGGNEMTQAAIRGEVDLAISSPSHALSAIQNGDCIALATLFHPIKALPGIRTLKELNLHVNLVLWRGVLAPPGTPDEIVKWLDGQFAKLVKNKSFVRMMGKIGEDIAYAPSQEFGERIKKEFDEAREIIQEIKK